MTDILVAGGAGYIGSHICKRLAESGYRPVVVDNLVCGHREAVRWGPLVEGSVNDADLMDSVFSQYRIAAVMHFAAFCYVGESVVDPAKYYRNNVAATLRLLESMTRHDVRRFIFSSSCATYGEPLEIPISETHPQAPINPYGRTKRMVEEILGDFDAAYGLRSVSLRYFNAAGADPDAEIGEDHHPETHLIPLVLQVAQGRRGDIGIFGGDYSTADGTCVRDYIHVNDLADAHILALERLLDDKPSAAYNLGNGDGYSVREVIEVARKVTGRPIPERCMDRRPGDPAVLVGSSENAFRELGWLPRLGDITAIIETAWRWHEGHPEGYGSKTRA